MCICVCVFVSQVCSSNGLLKITPPFYGCVTCLDARACCWIKRYNCAALRLDSETDGADARGEEEEMKKKEEVEPEAANKRRDDLAQRRAQTRPLPQREGPARFVTAPMSQADIQKWERLKMSDPR